MRQGASYISAAKPQKCYCMGSMNVVLANVALASAGSTRLKDSSSRGLEPWKNAVLVLEQPSESSPYSSMYDSLEQFS